MSLIRQALLEHKVIFFRGQEHLTDDSQYEFAELLAPPPPRASDRHVARHQGAAHRLRLRQGQQLAHRRHVRRSHPEGVDPARRTTPPHVRRIHHLASGVAAYNALPEPLKVLADNLWATHTNVYDYAATSAERAQDDKAKEYRAEFQSTYFETEHPPVVRVHPPETGERTLLLGHFVKSLVGLSSTQSQALFRVLQDHAISLEFTTRWNWQSGDVAIWDNRATQHYAVADYDDQYRRLNRITLAGDVPPVDIRGERSRSVAGDASGYSVIDEP